MPDPIMYQEDTFVLLMPGAAEVFLTPLELQQKLQAILSEQEQLPRDLQKFSTLEDQARHLMNTACEFQLKPGETLQWYAVRLEK
ncbi:MAG: chlororespiratory reduction protein 7 [Leptolyngbyaceae cyanobacterium SL_1_1]|nr:chlororespiratory reduction protein 7 [Leptolyngbyaceae cyanobacterium RM1_1_2]NJO11729.1 chlororespiratory reduction protein 7 [Leptolyngbyaceae cyanobacterium SL_1_1]